MDYQRNMGVWQVNKKCCPCGDKGCNKKDTGPGLEIKSKPFLSNDEYNIIHKRNKFELWVDQYTHTLEFTRTAVQILVFILQIIILWKVFN